MFRKEGTDLNNLFSETPKILSSKTKNPQKVITPAEPLPRNILDCGPLQHNLRTPG
jgi:hypothetical protein